jgi:CubicO group peptidase (beta-lactamase class C family)
MLLAVLAAAALSGLGPGRFEWKVDAPEKHGLDSAKLAEAATRIGQISERYCFLVFKGGTLIHETYYSNSSNTTYEIDSLGKSLTAELVGIAVTRGYLDLDTPIETYGVNVDIMGKYGSNLTMRHLLSQTTGRGHVPPGSHFTYDSDAFIMLISYTLGKVVPGGNVVKWATEEYAKPLGIPTVYTHPGQYAYAGTGNISAGGGQRMTCRDIGRVGQLLLNKGRWLDEANQTKVLYSKDYAEQMVRPSFPSFGTTYGFLTWLNRPGASPAFCCAPRWYCTVLYRSVPSFIII